MANRVVIKISGEELVLLTDDAPEYVRKVGAYVNDQMRNVVKAAKVGQTRAAIMAAVNIADELYKTREQDDQLRNQIKHYLEESSRQKGEISDLKREVLRLQKAQKKMEQEGGVKEKPAKPARAKPARSKAVKAPETAPEKEEADAPTGISSKTARVTALLDNLIEAAAEETDMPAVAEEGKNDAPAGTEEKKGEAPATADPASVGDTPVEAASAPVEAVSETEEISPAVDADNA